MVVNRETRISEILRKYPEARHVFVNHGMACISCMASDQDTLETGALMHDIEVEKLIVELNQFLGTRSGQS